MNNEKIVPSQKFATMGKQSSKNWLTTAIHVIGWGLLLCSPLMFAGAFGKSLDFNLYLLFAIVPFAHMIVFYMNFFIFIDRYLFKKNLGMLLLVNIVLIFALSLGMHYWHELLNPIRPPIPLYIILLRDSLLFLLTAALSVAIKVTANWYKTEKERQEIEKERAAAELKNLKSQLNPHFLFNTLNNIYSLVSMNPSQAQIAILSLSKLLRYVLYDNNQLTLPLSKELSFVKSYIELMSLRLSEKVKLSVNMPEPEDDKGLMIAPLMFITLIENAFKHGVNPVGESRIDILIEIKDSKIISCKIKNSFFPKTEDDRSGSGIGLDNLRKRLSLIYPGKYTLKSEREGDLYISELNITV